MGETNDDRTTNQARIVVVEDERVVALDIKAHLERFGYEVPAMYASGENLLENLERDRPDLVLLDIRLQGELDGVETGEKIQREYGLPFILLTAYADEQTLQRAKITQPFAYIIKPFDERELRTSIVIALYRHKMERALAERQELLQTTLSSITDGVIVTDSDRHVEFMNPVAERLCGATVEEIRGTPIEEICAFRQAEAGYWPKGFDRFARILESRSGDLIPVEVLETPLDSLYGASSGYVYVVRDISARVEAERALRQRDEQLRQAQKMEAVGRLSGGIAHDFNNLLTVILGYSKLLVETLEDEDEEIDREALKSDVLGIQKAAFRSVSLTRQLLAFSRHQMLNPRTIDINTIVEDVEKMLRRLLSEGIAMHVALNAERGTVLVDQGQMEQVLMNLVVNARDALTDVVGGTMVIRTEEISTEKPINVHTGALEPGQWIALHVQDNGAGIDPAHMQHIFEPFFTTKEMARGTGLGLATVYGIVRQLHGHIDVESTVGRGTTFSLYLPRADRANDLERSAGGEIDSLSGNEVVLLVEDEEPIRSLLTRVLLQQGYEVLGAQNAGEALLLAEDGDRHIDILVTDIVMPNISGTILAERLRRTRENLRVLLISGYAEELPGSDVSDSQYMTLLQKPFEPEELLRQIRHMLDS